MFLYYLAGILKIVAIAGIFIPIVIASKKKNNKWLLIIALFCFIMLPFVYSFSDKQFEVQYGHPNREPQQRDVEEGTAEYAYGYLVFEGDTVKIQKIYWKNQRELFTKYSKYLDSDGRIDYDKH